MAYQPLINRMQKIEELFRLSFEPNPLFEEFMKRNPLASINMRSASTDIRSKLSRNIGGPKQTTPEMNIFLNAFNAMNKTKGYSMEIYLQGNKTLAASLNKNLPKLESIYQQFLTFKENFRIAFPEESKPRPHTETEAADSAELDQEFDDFITISDEETPVPMLTQYHAQQTACGTASSSQPSWREYIGSYFARP